MSKIVPTGEIERLVGIERHPILHYGRVDNPRETFYILHSQECLDSGIDLRQCAFSRALDVGINIGYPGAAWNGYQDRPVPLAIWHEHLIPRID